MKFSYGLSFIAISLIAGNAYGADNHYRQIASLEQELASRDRQVEFAQHEAAKAFTTGITDTIVMADWDKCTRRGHADAVAAARAKYDTATPRPLVIADIVDMSYDAREAYIVNLRRLLEARDAELTAFTALKVSEYRRGAQQATEYPKWLCYEEWAAQEGSRALDITHKAAGIKPWWRKYVPAVAAVVLPAAAAIGFLLGRGYAKNKPA